MDLTDEELLDGLNVYHEEPNSPEYRALKELQRRRSPPPPDMEAVAREFEADMLTALAGKDFGKPGTKVDLMAHHRICKKAREWFARIQSDTREAERLRCETAIIAVAPINKIDTLLNAIRNPPAPSTAERT